MKLVGDQSLWDLGSPDQCYKHSDSITVSYNTLPRRLPLWPMFLPMVGFHLALRKSLSSENIELSVGQAAMSSEGTLRAESFDTFLTQRKQNMHSLSHESVSWSIRGLKKLRGALRKIEESFPLESRCT